MEPKEEKKKGNKKKKAFLYFVQVNVRVPFSSSDAYQKGDWDFPCFALLLLTLRFPGQELSISWFGFFFFLVSPEALSTASTIILHNTVITKLHTFRYVTCWMNASHLN